eukprot:TRINITY_DN43081_c0_g1_i1.p1 TRINITY_DN43081_c0_g1~~TRINITY_DN43081_c0_g1_i1.p1  ORF type:complete len:233 (-),score=40.54 TRINITY_DN43081_c0_g1_i1:61-759(-)
MAIVGFLAFLAVALTEADPSCPMSEDLTLLQSKVGKVRNAARQNVFNGTFPLVPASSDGVAPAFVQGSDFSDVVSRIESFQLCFLDDCAGRRVIEGVEGDSPTAECRFSDGRSARCACNRFETKGLYTCDGKVPPERQETHVIDTICVRVGECNTAFEQEQILRATIVANDTAALHVAVEQIAGVTRWKGNDTLVLLSGFAASEAASLLRETHKLENVGLLDRMKLLVLALC